MPPLRGLVRGALAASAPFVAAAVVSLSAAFPAPQKYVADGANVLDGTARQAINALLRGVEDDTTAEIAVVTVPALDGMTVEEYANRLFEAWGIGKKAAANGILILVAPAERKMRVEVGYGLEPILPDGLAGEIIRTEFLPRFRANDYAGGIRAGTARVAAVVRAKHVLTPAEREALAAASPDDRPPLLFTIPFFGAFIGIGAFMVGVGLASKAAFPLLWGALFGGIPLALALIPFFNAPALVLGPLAILAGVFGYRRALKSPSIAGAMAGTRRARAADGIGSAWSFGSGDSGSSSDSGGSSDSFGGGSSGGGGASGSW